MYIIIVFLLYIRSLCVFVCVCVCVLLLWLDYNEFQLHIYLIHRTAGITTTKYETKL